MTAEACIAHQLECLVHPGEFVRVEQLRPGASYLMLVTGVEYFDYMKKSDQTKLEKFGWKVDQLPGEWIVRGRWASAVGGADGVFTTRTATLPAGCRLEELVLRSELALWPAREILAAVDVVLADKYRAGELDGLRDAYVLKMKGDIGVDARTPIAPEDLTFPDPVRPALGGGAARPRPRGARQRSRDCVPSRTRARR